MAVSRKTIFLSDLHLDQHHPEITENFFKFLKNLDFSIIDAMYILGDLFEVWIGDDENTEFHRKIITALKSITQKGVPIYFMYGNRDFLIGKKFLRETGCKLLADEEKISLYGTALLLMHGDTLCTQDIAYLKARKKGRNVFIQTLFLLLPLKIRKHIANKMRAKSARHTQSTPVEIMDVTQDEVKRVMEKHGVLNLVHGHTHRPNVHEFLINHSNATRIVLGAWHDGGDILEWNELGERNLIKNI